MIESRLDNELTAQLTAEIRRQYETEAALHEPSGKLSASQLGKPLLEQVLKVLGVPAKPVEDYALGLFRRGNSVEDTILELLEPDEVQKEASYRDCIGFIDAIKGDRVFEVKSIKNSQVPYRDPNNKKRPGSHGAYEGPAYAHTLQGALYALSEGKDEFTIIYVAADDLRTYPHVIQVSEIQPEVDKIIDEVKDAIKSRILPVWKPREDWQAKYPQYSSYPDWMTLDQETAMEKLKLQHELAYKKLTGEK